MNQAVKQAVTYKLLSLSAAIDDCDRVITLGEEIPSSSALPYPDLYAQLEAINADHIVIQGQQVDPSVINCFIIPEQDFNTPWRLKVITTRGEDPEPEDNEISYIEMGAGQYSSIWYKDNYWTPRYAWVTEDHKAMVALAPYHHGNPATDWEVIELYVLSGGVDANTCVEYRLVADDRIWSVFLYETDKAFGGPEEGGWYYDVGTRVDSAILYRELGMEPRLFTRYLEARKYMDDMRRVLDGSTLNEGRHRPGSVLCRGWYAVEMNAGLPPAGYPAQRPHYE